MKLLLDTHTFIWWDANPARLSPRVLSLLQDRSATALLSVVSIWEMLVKLQLGKLSLRLPLPEIVAQQVANGIGILPVSLDHVLGLEVLPALHKDPFDRLLIAQARVENATLLSADHVFAGYLVQVLW